MKQVDIAVIGGGAAGLAAALAAKQAGCDNILIIEREGELGGILNQCIHNGFGLHVFKEELTGPEYAERYLRQIKEYNIPFQTGTFVLDIKQGVVTTMSERSLEKLDCKAIILATGCRERPRGALMVPGTRAAGIYTAGTAQKLINRMGLLPGKKAVILGSGDIGLIMARRMTLEGAIVPAVLEIMPYSSGLARNVTQCLEDFGIPLMLSHTVTAIQGTRRVTGVTIAQVDEFRKPIDGTQRQIECDTLLLSVGLIPENELARAAGVGMSAITQGAVVDQNLATDISGFFQCGNALHVHDLVDNVSIESERAGRQAVEYLSGKRTDSHTTVISDGSGVSGCVPGLLRGTPSEPVNIMFRPREFYRGARVTVYCDGVKVASIKKPVLAPGEMAEIKLKPELIMPGTKQIIVNVEAAQ